MGKTKIWLPNMKYKCIAHLRERAELISELETLAQGISTSAPTLT